MQCIDNIQSLQKSIKRVLFTEMLMFIDKKTREMPCIVIFEEALFFCANRFF